MKLFTRIVFGATLITLAGYGTFALGRVAKLENRVTQLENRIARLDGRNVQLEQRVEAMQQPRVIPLARDELRR